jgi:hypothetical protein
MSDDCPLYRSEPEIARSVLGPGHLAEWRAMAVIYQREGMPYDVDPMTGKFYWPKIKAWLDAYNLVDKITPAPIRRSRSEKWDIPTSRRPGSGSGSASPVQRLHTGLPRQTT